MGQRRIIIIISEVNRAGERQTDRDRESQRQTETEKQRQRNRDREIQRERQRQRERTNAGTILFNFIYKGNGIATVNTKPFLH